LRHGGRDFASRSLDQPVHHFSNAGPVAVNPIKVGEFAAGGVVIDIDLEELSRPANEYGQAHRTRAE